MSSPTHPTASSARTKSPATKASGPAQAAMNSRRKERLKTSSGQTPGKGTELSGPVSKAAYVMYFALASVAGSTDILSKEAVFRTFGYPGEQPTSWLIQDRFGIQTALNPGALFGMGEGKRLIFA